MHSRPEMHRHRPIYYSISLIRVHTPATHDILILINWFRRVRTENFTFLRIAHTHTHWTRSLTAQCLPQCCVTLMPTSQPAAAHDRLCCARFARLAEFSLAMLLRDHLCVCVCLFVPLAIVRSAGLVCYLRNVCVNVFNIDFEINTSRTNTANSSINARSIPRTPKIHDLPPSVRRPRALFTITTYTQVW